MWIRRAVAILALGAALTASGPPPAAAAPPAELQVLRLVNDERLKRSLPPLRRSRPLERSARLYAAYMLRRDRFGHLRRIRGGGRFAMRAETLAIQPATSPRGVVRAWLRSPAHRRILLSPRLRHAGFGAARGRMGRMRATTWVGHFGRR